MTSLADLGAEFARPEFACRLAAHGDAPALVMRSGIVTYAELASRAAAFSTSLSPGRKLIAIEAALSSQAIAAYLGALQGGHAVVLTPAGDEAVRLAIEE